MKRTRKYPLKSEKVLSAGDLTAAGLRFLVANYYQSQEMRKRSDLQFRHLGDRVETMSEQTFKILRYSNESFADIEEQVAKAIREILIDPTSSWFHVANWTMAQRGIGPIITAGLIAHIDIEKAPTAGHIWAFAGLNPDMKWEKGQIRPYNAELKQLTWHAGQCFMKQSNDPDCFYGHLYRERKQYEIKRNEAGGNAEKAAMFKISSGATKAVKDKLNDGKLPDFNIDARARRYAVKIFLSHLHVIMYWDKYKKIPPLPFAIQHLGHAHKIMIPMIEMFLGLKEAYYFAGTMLEAAE